MGRKEAADVVRAFFSGTSCHGLQQIDGGGRIRTVAWMAAVIFTCCLCTYQFVNLGLQIRRYEVTIVPEISDDPIPFPAITMCNLNPYKTSKLYKIPQLKALEKITSSLTGGGLKNMSKANEKARRKRSSDDTLAKPRSKRNAPGNCSFTANPNKRLVSQWEAMAWETSSVDECSALCEATPGCPGFALRKGGTWRDVCYFPPPASTPTLQDNPGFCNSYKVFPDTELGEAALSIPAASHSAACFQHCDTDGTCAAFSFRDDGSVCKLFHNNAVLAGFTEGGSPGTDLFAKAAECCSEDAYLAIFDGKAESGSGHILSNGSLTLGECMAECDARLECGAVNYRLSTPMCNLKAGVTTAASDSDHFRLYKPTTPCAEDWYEKSGDCAAVMPSQPCAWNRIPSFIHNDYTLIALDRGIGTTSHFDCQESCRRNPNCLAIQMAGGAVGATEGCAHYGQGSGATDPLSNRNSTYLQRPSSGCEADVTTPPPPANSSACLDVFPHVVKDGYCYRALNETRVPRAAAKTHCEGLGGFLAALPTEPLRSAMKYYLNSELNLADRAWVALQQADDSPAPNAGWFWETPYGRSAPVDMDAVLWGSGEPNDAGGGENNKENQAPMAVDNAKYFDAANTSEGWPICMFPMDESCFQFVEGFSNSAAMGPATNEGADACAHRCLTTAGCLAFLIHDPNETGSTECQLHDAVVPVSPQTNVDLYISRGICSATTTVAVTLDAVETTTEGCLTDDPDATNCWRLCQHAIVDGVCYASTHDQMEFVGGVAVAACSERGGFLATAHTVELYNAFAAAQLAGWLSLTCRDRNVTEWTLRDGTVLEVPIGSLSWKQPNNPEDPCLKHININANGDFVDLSGSGGTRKTVCGFDNSTLTTTPSPSVVSSHDCPYHRYVGQDHGSTSIVVFSDVADPLECTARCDVFANCAGVTHLDGQCYLRETPTTLTLRSEPGGYTFFWRSDPTCAPDSGLATSSHNCTYTRLVGKDMASGGGLLGNLKKTGGERNCMALCDVLPGCFGAMLNTANNNCWLKEATGLVTMANYSTQSYTFFVRGDAACGAPDPVDCEWSEQDALTSPYSLDGTPFAASEAQCRQLCAAHPLCFGALHDGSHCTALSDVQHNVTTGASGTKLLKHTGSDGCLSTTTASPLVQSENNCTYTRYPSSNHGAGGYVIAVVYAVTQPIDCTALCDAESDCVGAVHLESLSSSSCWLKFGPVALDLQEEDATYTFFWRQDTSCSAATPMKAPIESTYNCSYVGFAGLDATAVSDIAELHGVNMDEDCMALCDATPDCGGATFLPSLEKCWLKTAPADVPRLTAHKLNYVYYGRQTTCQAPPPEACEWEVLVGQTVGDTQGGTHAAVGEETCTAICAAHPLCQGALHRPSSNECNLLEQSANDVPTTQTGTNLIRKLGAQGCLTTTTTSPFVNSDNGCPYIEYSDTDHGNNASNNMASVASVSDPVECTALCDALAACVGAVHDGAASRCWLKRTPTSPQLYPNITGLTFFWRHDPSCQAPAAQIHTSASNCSYSRLSERDMVTDYQFLGYFAEVTDEQHCMDLCDALSACQAVVHTSGQKHCQLKASSSAWLQVTSGIGVSMFIRNEPSCVAPDEVDCEWSAQAGMTVPGSLEGSLFDVTEAQCKVLCAAHPVCTGALHDGTSCDLVSDTLNHSPTPVTGSNLLKKLGPGGCLTTTTLTYSLALSSAGCQYREFPLTDSPDSINTASIERISGTAYDDCMDYCDSLEVCQGVTQTATHCYLKKTPAAATGTSPDGTFFQRVADSCVTPPVPQCLYSRTEGMGPPSNDHKRSDIRVPADEEECMGLCSAHAECVAASWSGAFCRLYASTEIAAPSPGGTTLLTKLGTAACNASESRPNRTIVASASGCAYQRYDDVDFPTGDLNGTMLQTDTAEDCMEECDGSADCVAVVHADRCFMKDATAVTAVVRMGPPNHIAYRRSDTACVSTITTTTMVPSVAVVSQAGCPYERFEDSDFVGVDIGGAGVGRPNVTAESCLELCDALADCVAVVDLTDCWLKGAASATTPTGMSGATAFRRANASCQAPPVAACEGDWAAGTGATTWNHLPPAAGLTGLTKSRCGALCHAHALCSGAWWQGGTTCHLLSDFAAPELSSGDHLMTKLGPQGCQTTAESSTSGAVMSTSPLKISTTAPKLTSSGQDVSTTAPCLADASDPTAADCRLRCASVTLNGVCYALTASIVNPKNAVLLCRARGGYLASAHSDEILQALIDSQMTMSLGAYLNMECVGEEWFWRLRWGGTAPPGHNASLWDAGSMPICDEPGMVLTTKYTLAARGGEKNAICEFPDEPVTTLAPTTPETSATTALPSTTLAQITTMASTSKAAKVYSSTSLYSTEEHCENSEPSASNCASQCGRVVLEGVCYAQTASSGSSDDRKGHCQSHGGFLATAHTDPIFDALAASQLSGLLNARCVIRVAGLVKDGHWELRNGSSVDMEDSGLLSFGSLDCLQPAVILNNIDRKLTSVPDEGPHRAICEFPLSTTTTADQTSAPGEKTTSPALTTANNLPSTTSTDVQEATSTAGCVDSEPTAETCRSQCKHAVVEGVCYASTRGTTSKAKGESKCEGGGGRLASPHTALLRTALQDAGLKGLLNVHCDTTGRRWLLEDASFISAQASDFVPATDFTNCSKPNVFFANDGRMELLLSKASRMALCEFHEELTTTAAKDPATTTSTSAKLTTTSTLDQTTTTTAVETDTTTEFQSSTNKVTTRAPTTTSESLSTTEPATTQDSTTASLPGSTSVNADTISGAGADATSLPAATSTVNAVTTMSSSATSTDTTSAPGSNTEELSSSTTTLPRTTLPRTKADERTSTVPVTTSEAASERPTTTLEDKPITTSEAKTSEPTTEPPSTTEGKTTGPPPTVQETAQLSTSMLTDPTSDEITTKSRTTAAPTTSEATTGEATTKQATTKGESTKFLTTKLPTTGRLLEAESTKIPMAGRATSEAIATTVDVGDDLAKTSFPTSAMVRSDVASTIQSARVTPKQAAAGTGTTTAAGILTSETPDRFNSFPSSASLSTPEQPSHDDDTTTGRQVIDGEVTASSKAHEKTTTALNKVTPGDMSTTTYHDTKDPQDPKDLKNPKDPKADKSSTSSFTPGPTDAPTLEEEVAAAVAEKVESAASEELEELVAEVIQEQIQESIQSAIEDSVADAVQSGLGDSLGLGGSAGLGGLGGGGFGGLQGQQAVGGAGDFAVPLLPGESAGPTVAPPPPPEPDQSAIVTTLKDSLPLLVAQLGDEQLAEVGVTAEETFAACHYDKVPCHIEKFKRVVDKRFGNCFVFNWDGTRNVTRASKDHGFFVQMAIHKDEYMRAVCCGLSLTESTGMRVAFHEPGVVAVPYTQGFNVAAGYRNSFQLTYSQVIHVGEPFSPCVGAPNRSTFLFEGGYSLDGCLESCMQTAVVEQCNCEDPTKPALPDRNLTRCDLVRKKCLDVILASDKALDNVHCDACADPCLYSSYQRTMTQNVWPQENEEVHQCAVALTTRGRQSDEYQRCLREAGEDTVTMQVKLNKLSHIKYRETPKIDSSDVFSSVGGNLGIALGMSILSLVEIALFLFNVIRALMK